MDEIRDIRDIAVTIAAVLLIISMVHWEGGSSGKGLYFGLPISSDNAKRRSFYVDIDNIRDYIDVRHKNSCVD